MKKTAIQKKLKKYFLVLITSMPVLAFSQTTVTPNTSAITLAQDIVGSGVTVTAANFNKCGGVPTGSVVSAGTFTNTSGDLGISNGIILTTGTATDAGLAYTYTASTQLSYTYTDHDLVTISSGSIYDVCSLSFTFTPVCNQLSITYVFASEEWPRYICGTGTHAYNDAFGIFLTGVNPSGGNYVAQNIATLPNAAHTPVQIDSINDNYNNLCGKPENVSYFVNNGGATGHHYNDIVYDGFTVPVTSVTGVAPCSTYVMEIAIGEAGNGKFDSGVFIKGSSVGCGAPPAITASATPNNCGSNNGTATAMVSGFSGTPTYSWTPGGQTTGTISGLATGVYTCSVGLPSCSSTAYTTVTATVTNGGSPPSLSISGTQTLCAGNSTTLTGGTAANYTWMPGNITTNTITVSPASNTTYTLTGANGTCTASAVATVSVNTNPVISVNDPSSCAGQAIILQASPSTLSTYTWTGVSSSTSTASVAPNTTTSYTVAGTDANGCVSNSAVATVSITASVQISVTSSSNPPCINSNYTLTANGANTYTWVPNVGTFTALDGNNTQISVTQGTAAVTFTVSGTGSCPATQDVFTVTPAPVTTLTISPSNNSMVCFGGTVTVSASGANSYTWTPTISNGVAFTPTTSTVYSVAATDNYGCTIDSSVSIIVNNPPVFTVNAPPICAGQTATLTASQSTYTYTWQGSASTASTITVTPSTSPQTYTVSAVDGNGCESSVVTATVTTNPLPTISITANPANATICTGGTITLTASGASTYTWTPSITNGTAFTPTVSQSYSVYATDANGCTNVTPQTADVTVNPITTLVVTGNPACSGSNSTFTAAGANSYTWSTSDLTSSITVLASNNQTYTVIGTDANNCPTAPAIATATVNPLPNVTVASNPTSGAVCAGSNATLTASGAQTYTWSTGSTNNPITVNPTTPITYTVVGTDGNNCSNFFTIPISINPLPTAQTITASSPLVCIGAINPPVTLSASNPGTWVGPAPSTATISANSASISVTHGGVYTLYTTNSCGSAASPPFTLAADSVIANFTATPVTGQTPLFVTYMNTSTALASNTLSYNWAFGDGNSSITTNTTNLFTGAATYQTTLTATDNLGCKDTATVYIVVNVVPPVIVIPNIFTPNGDGKNDIFEIDATGINNFDCKVYDRWGLLLHEWQGTSGGWDGKARNGNNCTDGTYFYIITYTDNYNKSTIKDGFFQLIR
jgi:gliding motility-associated-like protein